MLATILHFIYRKSSIFSCFLFREMIRNEIRLLFRFAKCYEMKFHLLFRFAKKYETIFRQIKSTLRRFVISQNKVQGENENPNIPPRKIGCCHVGN
jgi:hypothetical protein